VPTVITRLHIWCFKMKIAQFQIIKCRFPALAIIVGNKYHIPVILAKTAGGKKSRLCLATADTAETEPITEPICICDEKCITGEVNPKCEVCRLTMSECVGWEVIQNPPDKSEDIGEKNNGGILLVLLLAAVGGGAAVWYFKYYKPKQQNKITSAPDEYEFDEEEEIEFEETEEV